MSHMWGGRGAPENDGAGMCELVMSHIQGGRGAPVTTLTGGVRMTYPSDALPTASHLRALSCVTSISTLRLIPTPLLSGKLRFPPSSPLHCLCMCLANSQLLGYVHPKNLHKYICFSCQIRLFFLPSKQEPLIAHPNL